MTMLVARKSAGLFIHLMLTRNSRVGQSALVTCSGGWRPTDCNPIHPRLSSSSVHLHASNSRLQLPRYLRSCCRYDLGVCLDVDVSDPSVI